jgi:hypothetical protein
MSGVETIHTGASLARAAAVGGSTHKFRIIENFLARSGKTVSLTATAQDNTYKLFDKGYRATLVYDGTGTDNAYVQIDFSSGYPYVLDPNDGLYVAAYIHQVNANSVMAVLPSTNFATNNNTWTASIGSYEPGFVMIPMSGMDYTPYGTDAVSGPYNRLRLYLRQASGSAGQTTDVTFLGLFQGRRRKGRVVLGFDDAYVGAHTYGLPRLTARGMVGQIWCDGRELGSTWEGNPVMSAAQLRECQAAGWDVGVQAHGRHDILDTEAAITADVAAAKAALVAAGVSVSAMYAYDGGQRSATPANSYNALAANGFTHARLTTPLPLLTLGEQIVDGYRLNRQAWPGVGVAQTQLAGTAVATQIERAVLGGTDVICYMHEIEATTIIGGRESTDMTVAQFDTFLSMIDAYRNSGSLDVVTMTELAETAPQSVAFYWG